MRRNFSRGLFNLLAFVLIFTTFSFGATTNGGIKSQTQFTELPLAEIFEDIEISSSRPTSVIVELKAESIVEAKNKDKVQTKDSLKAERYKVINDLEKAIKNADVNREYDYVFSGFSVELPANEIIKLLAIPGVKAVYPNVHYTADVISAEEISTEAFSPNMMESAPFIGSKEAWEAGFTGKGITVAIIDTGVDYTHGDLNHAFGDYKGWDFVDNDNDPQEGSGQYDGTHVAGTVAANGNIKGVAPEAKLLAYRVLGPNGGTTENVVAGIEKAVQDGADVMNLSLGNTLNNPDWATSIALDWAMTEGVVAVTSNGNSGPNNWTVGSPGTSRQAISVGAVLYNNVAGSMPLIPGMDVPTIMLNQADRQALLAKANDVTISFDIKFTGAVGETMADFSSRGPVTFTWMIKPDVSAPGVNIVSTFPGNSYAA